MLSFLKEREINRHSAHVQTQRWELTIRHELGDRAWESYNANKKTKPWEPKAFYHFFQMEQLCKLTAYAEFAHHPCKNLHVAIDANVKNLSIINAGELYETTLRNCVDSQPTLFLFLLAYVNVVINMNKEISYQEYHPLMLALISHNISIYQKNANGKTALTLAGIYGFSDTVRLLLDQGALPDIDESTGHCTLFEDLTSGVKESLDRTAHDLNRPCNEVQLNQIKKRLEHAQNQIDIMSMVRASIRSCI